MGLVASSREDAWIETDRNRCKRKYHRSRPPARTRGLKLIYKTNHINTLQVASSREDAWIETYTYVAYASDASRVLPRGRVD